MAKTTQIFGPSGPVLCIEGELTLIHALELQTELVCSLEQAPRLDIDLSQVREIDSAGVQLLLLAKRTATEHGKELRLLEISPAVLEVLQLLNLSAYFDDPQVGHSTRDVAP